MFIFFGIMLVFAGITAWIMVVPFIGYVIGRYWEWANDLTAKWVGDK